MMKKKYPKHINKFTTVCVEAALAGGKVLEKHYNTGIKVSYKGRIDPVTAADKTSQDVITKIIKKHFPDHTVVGEEDEKHPECSEYCWIIDPLDGTVNFIHGMKLFSVSIALTHKGKILSGVVYAPMLDELFVAQKGLGSFLNGVRIRVSDKNTLIRSLVVTGFPYDVDSKTNEVIASFKNMLTNAQGVRRLGSAALDMCYVACGRMDAFWELGLKAWDVAAGALIVNEAGGRVTDFEGKNNFLYGGRLLASNGLIHNKMKSLIKK